MFSRLFWRATLLTGALVTPGSYSYGSTIVSVTDYVIPANRGSFFLGGEFSNVVLIRWTQTASFSNIVIDASLVSIDDSFRSGTAYLMNAIGPGTTTASEVLAPANFTAPVGSPFGPVPLTTLFSGLTLGPGTYYLVLAAPFRNETFGSPLRWQVPNGSVVTTAPSVTAGNSLLSETLDSRVDPFPPASSFFAAAPPGYPAGVQPMFDVISAPEPETSVVILISLAALMLYRWATCHRRCPKNTPVWPARSRPM